ncbi:UNVERIFIED_CONTAM: protein WHAT'S THIS FACTOR 9, mitochondrial [Sesamum radiatum]|uniref:Protein WHAT'S THIS FACTOR 9, mitochondrial n=1 Tax=Sesamum radiatum TaxID=300843 RepID=A0AAW2TX32_SESRA
MVSKLMIMRNPNTLLQKLLFSSSPNPIFPLWHHHPPPSSYTQIQTYVEVYMKWKKDPYFDSIDSIHKSLELKPIISLKNFFISFPRLQKTIIVFLSQLSPRKKAIELDKEERMVYEEFRGDIVGRLKKLILMSGTRKMLPLKVIKGLRWSLGLPDEFFMDPLDYVGDRSFEIVDIEDGLKGLAISQEYDDRKGGKILSMMQKNAMSRGVYNGGGNEAIAFPLFPSKGLRLKHKIKDWLDEFQRLPYVSPYDDFSCLNPDSDISEKRVNKTCTAILKEAYCDELAIDPHPLAKVRKEYIALMKESVVMLRNKRMNGCRAFHRENVCSNDLRSADGERIIVHESMVDWKSLLTASDPSNMSFMESLRLPLDDPNVLPKLRGTKYALLLYHRQFYGHKLSALSCTRVLRQRSSLF